jgi:hypothetical protein
VKPFSFFILVVTLLGSAALAADYTGKVVSPDGKPVKDATVYLFGNSGRSLAADLSTHRDAPTTRCDDNGDFHFPPIAPNGGQFIAVAPGFGLGVTPILPDRPAEIRLSRRTDVTLTFLTPDKKPVASVAVFLQNAYFPVTTFLRTSIWIPPGYNSPWSATTDANGVCTIPGLPQGAQAEFSVADERYAQLSRRDEVVLDTTAKTHADPIHLLAASTISGVVTYATTGKPAAGIVVAAHSSETGDTEAVTAADGSYTVKQLRPGQYVVTLYPDDQLLKSWTAKAVENIALGAGSAKSEVNLSLIPGVILTGTAVAADNGNPVAGVPLVICGPAYPRNSSSFQTVRTDANGAFAARVPPGEQFVYVASSTPADGFGRPSPDSKTVTISDGQTASVEFRLPRVLMVPVKGKVVDPDGNPVAGASIFTSSDDSPMFQNMAITTGGDGTFQTLPMPRTGQLQIRARFKDLATSKALAVNRASHGDVVVQLEKNALASISGRVLDPQGQPIKGAQILLIIRTGRNYAFGQNGGSTDEQGYYTVASLWADAVYSVEAMRDGYGMANTSDLRLEPGQTTRARDLTLYKRDSTIAGVLLDADGKPIAGTRINLNGPRTGYSNVTTDANGQFTCSVVSGDRLNLSYNTPSGYRSRIAGAGDQKIVLRTAPPKRAPPPPAPAAPAAEVAPPPPPPPLVFDPAAAVTWNGWLYAAVLVVVGGIISVIANAIAALRSPKRQA